MAEKRTTNTNVTRYDKAHKKFMDKLNVLKDNVNHGYDSLKVVHKQTVDSSVSFKETVDKEDEKKIQWAKERIQELDRIKEKEIDGHNEFLKEEGDTTKRNIVGGMMLIAVSAKLISSKQVRQMGGKAISSVGKSLLRLKK